VREWGSGGVGEWESGRVGEWGSEGGSGFQLTASILLFLIIMKHIYETYFQSQSSKSRTNLFI
jgi:hypothetical protein